MLFWTFGYTLMYGGSHLGIVGLPEFLSPLNENSEFTKSFLFQVMFCGTATTIVAGAVAERMKFGAYLVIAILLSGLIYPLFGHWAWNSLGWLNNVGFSDFAGSTVVHSIGAWVALAAIIIIGPRIGRFSENSPNEIQGHDLPVAILGTLLLWLGWFGFNGGSVKDFKIDEIYSVLTNTILAGTFGMITTLAIGWWRDKLPKLQSVIYGSLAGLVAITASCNMVNQAQAMVIGSVGGLCMLACESLLERCHIDDVVGAIPVHGAAGVWGTLAVSLFGEFENPLKQLTIQLLGVCACFIWAFGSSYLFLGAINTIWKLRVSPEDERKGLNFAEHGATTEVHDFLAILDQQAKTGDLSARAQIETFSESLTDIGQIARRYNHVMDRLQQADGQMRLKSNYLATMSHKIRNIVNGIIGVRGIRNVSHRTAT